MVYWVGQKAGLGFWLALMTNPKEFEFGTLTTAETTDLHKGFFGGGRVKKIWNRAQQEAESLQNTISASLAKAMTVKQAAEDW